MALIYVVPQKFPRILIVLFSTGDPVGVTVCGFDGAIDDGFVDGDTVGD